MNFENDTTKCVKFLRNVFFFWDIDLRFFLFICSKMCISRSLCSLYFLSCVYCLVFRSRYNAYIRYPTLKVWYPNPIIKIPAARETYVYICVSYGQMQHNKGTYSLIKREMTWYLLEKSNKSRKKQTFAHVSFARFVQKCYIQKNNSHCTGTILKNNAHRPNNWPFARVTCSWYRNKGLVPYVRELRPSQYW